MDIKKKEEEKIKAGAVPPKKMPGPVNNANLGAGIMSNIGTAPVWGALGRTVGGAVKTVGSIAAHLTSPVVKQAADIVEFTTGMKPSPGSAVPGIIEYPKKYDIWGNPERAKAAAGAGKPLTAPADYMAGQFGAAPPAQAGTTTANKAEDASRAGGFIQNLETGEKKWLPKGKPELEEHKTVDYMKPYKEELDRLGAMQQSIVSKGFKTMGDVKLADFQIKAMQERGNTLRAMMGMPAEQERLGISKRLADTQEKQLGLDIGKHAHEVKKWAAGRDLSDPQNLVALLSKFSPAVSKTVTENITTGEKKTEEEIDWTPTLKVLQRFGIKVPNPEEMQKASTDKAGASKVSAADYDR